MIDIQYFSENAECGDGCKPTRHCIRAESRSGSWTWRSRREGGVRLLRSIVQKKGRLQTQDNTAGSTHEEEVQAVCNASSIFSAR